MNSEHPVIRKTKKSSYKPLSKLNEDHLTELKRVEKPEYTSRVFFCNTSVRAQLQNNVNVWFRDHQHNMALINRQQRAIMKLMGRVQRDRHRVRKAEYQRKQQEIRANMKRLQEELLQRRVIQKFRRNADNKMASRGLKSLAGLRLTAQLRTDSDGEDFAAEDTDGSAKEGARNPVALLGSIVDYTAVVTENPARSEEGLPKGDAAADHPSTSQLCTPTNKSSRRESSFSGAHRPQNPSLDKGRDQERVENSGGGFSPSQQQATTSIPSAMKSSNPGPTSSKELRTSDSSSCMLLGSGTILGQESPGIVYESQPGTSTVITPTNDRVKNKHCSLGTTEQGEPASVENSAMFAQLEDTAATHSPACAESPDDSVAQTSALTMDARVVEVKKSIPGSSAVVVQTTRRRDSIPRTTTFRTTSSTAQEVVSMPHDSATSITGPPPTPQTQDRSIKETLDKTQYKENAKSTHASENRNHLSASSSQREAGISPASGSGLHSGPSALQTKSGPAARIGDSTRIGDSSRIGDSTRIGDSSRIGDSRSAALTPREGVSFRDMVSRDKAEEDARLLLNLAGGRGRGEGDQAEGGKGKTTLTHRVRLERQQAAKRRANMLDSEPLTQYYRSSRGSLEPLQTEAWRRQFSLPTGRVRHHQGKLLRQEHQRCLDRQRHIEQFFTDLCSRRLGQPNLKPETSGGDSAEEPQTNHLELLLKKMRQRTRARAPSIDWNSVEQLAKCQYLRLHHQRDEGEGRAAGTTSAEDRMKMTSWAHAETRLRGGFVHSRVLDM